MRLLEKRERVELWKLLTSGDPNDVSELPRSSKAERDCEIRASLLSLWEITTFSGVLVFDVDPPPKKLAIRRWLRSGFLDLARMVDYKCIQNMW